MPRARTVLPDRVDAQGGLRLRRWVIADAPELAAAVAQSVDHLRPWMGWAAQEPLSIQDRRRMIHQWKREWENGGDVLLGMFLAGRIVGGCGLHRLTEPDGLEIGYWVHPSFLRRGMATNAAGALTGAALALPDIDHVEIHHDKANVASAGVPRKLGFRLLGEEPDSPEAPAELGIELRWRMDAETWERARERRS